MNDRRIFTITVTRPSVEVVDVYLKECLVPSSAIMVLFLGLMSVVFAFGEPMFALASDMDLVVDSIPFVWRPCFLQWLSGRTLDRIRNHEWI